MQKKEIRVNSPYQPKGDQPKAISKLAANFKAGDKSQILMGVTGSGKTFTMAHLIQELNSPTLIVAHNKTLAAQLFTEMKELFPDNAVGFFISYYDYYQPEAYLPTTDTYIAKDSSINDDIDKMRHEATRNLFERQDVIIVASVSCIYGLGSPESYARQVVSVEQGMEIERNALLRKLIEIQYTRNDIALNRGNFRVRGDVVDILPSHQRDSAIRVEFFGDEIDRVSFIDVLTGKTIKEVPRLTIYPNSHYIAERDNMQKMVKTILVDLGKRLKEFRGQDKLVEAQRIEQRTMHDVELLEELGYCSGIENYSRYLTGKNPGEPPPTLLDYFPDDFLTIIDESHMSVPQLGGMYRGDRSRKQTLVDFGFRLPSALDNRPLNFNEFMERNSRVLYVSATPGNYELESCGGKVVEQIIRPTGLIDPKIIVKPAKSQVDDLYGELNDAIKVGGRVLITTLTKRMAEDLTQYYEDLGLKVKYLHSDIDSLERMELLRDFRKGDFDILIGINLLREGLDLPEVVLVAVMDADQEGFLRSRSALIQVVGRAARNVSGRVIFYADKITKAMQECIDETERRRKIQIEYNKKNNINPTSVVKKMSPGLREIYGLTKEDEKGSGKSRHELLSKYKIENGKDLDRLIRQKSKEMKKAAENLEFEKAAEIRDLLTDLKDLMLAFGEE